MPTKDKKTAQKIWVLSFIILAEVYCIYASLIPLVITKNSYATPGQFGDMFGALNAFVTGLAFAGFLYTSYLQRKDLEAQGEMLEKQGFENTFFQILNHFTNVARAVRYMDRSGIHALDQHDYYMREHIKNNPSPKNPQELQNKSKIYFKNSELRLYFRTLYCLLTYIDTSEVANKPFYIDLILSQISLAELSLTFYFCLPQDEGKLKNLIEKYSLFKNLSIERLIAKEHAELYSENAFKTI